MNVEVSKEATLLYKLLRNGSVYRVVQNAVSTRQKSEVFAKAFFENHRPKKPLRVLDIGCGPGTFLENYGAAVRQETYWGIDPNRSQIKMARARFSGAKFSVGTVSDFQPRPEFDLVTCGALHHVPDDEVRRIIAFAAESLVSGGRFVSIEAVLYDGQKALERFFTSLDRGKAIRSPDEYMDLARESTKGTDIDFYFSIWTNLLRIPFAHGVLVGKKK